MARHDGDVRGDAEKSLSIDEVLALLGHDGGGTDRSREDAMACYLSGGDGWREAIKLLGGTFAEGASRLRERKSD